MNDKMKLKVVLIGNAIENKMTYARRLESPMNYDAKDYSTIGSSIFEFGYKYNEKIFEVQLWDVAGQEKYRSLLPTYIRDCDGAILIYDCESRSSFEYIARMLEKLKESCQNYGTGSMPIIIIIADNYSSGDYEVSEEEVKAFASKENIPFVFCDTKTGEFVDSSFRLLIRLFEEREEKKTKNEKVEKPEFKIVDKEKKKSPFFKPINLFKKKSPKKADNSKNESSSKNENDDDSKKEDEKSDHSSPEAVLIPNEKFDQLVDHVHLLENHLSKYEKISTYNFESFEVEPSKDSWQRQRPVLDISGEAYLTSEKVNSSSEKDLKISEKVYLTSEKVDASSEKVLEISEKVYMSSEKVDVSSENNIDQNSSSEEENCYIGEDKEVYFETVKKIGEGTTSVAYKIIDKRTLKPFCKKVLNVEDVTFDDVQNAVKEFQVLHSLHHPSICHAVGINPAEVLPGQTKDGNEVTTVALFLEYIDYTLKDCLSKNLLNSTLKAQIVVEISHGMRYIHSKQMIYRDLQIDSIMLNSVYQVKLIDFGLVRVNECLFGEEMMNTISMTKNVGSAFFMSPEMAKEEDYDNKTDVYSFGIVLYYIFTGSLPRQTLKEKAKEVPIPLPEESDSISNCCIELISNCLSNDPKVRPSFEEILIYLRENKYMLASDVDPSIVSQRDNELNSFH